MFTLFVIKVKVLFLINHGKVVNSTEEDAVVELELFTKCEEPS